MKLCYLFLFSISLFGICLGDVGQVNPIAGGGSSNNFPSGITANGIKDTTGGSHVNAVTAFDGTGMLVPATASQMSIALGATSRGFLIGGSTVTSTWTVLPTAVSGTNTGTSVSITAGATSLGTAGTLFLSGGDTGFGGQAGSIDIEAGNFAPGGAPGKILLGTNGSTNLVEIAPNLVCDSIVIAEGLQDNSGGTHISSVVAFDASGNLVPAPTGTYFRPAPIATSNSTGTATFNSTSKDETIYNNSATTVSALTITLPTSSTPGQIVRYATKAITTTITMAGGTVDIGTAPTTSAAGNVFIWICDVSGHWIRTQ